MQLSFTRKLISHIQEGKINHLIIGEGFTQRTMITLLVINFRETRNMTVTRPPCQYAAHFRRARTLWTFATPGAPLIWFPAPAADRENEHDTGTAYGDETSSRGDALLCVTHAKSPSPSRRHHVVLAVNPDGCQLGLRTVTSGIDLNRNFPAANWKRVKQFIAEISRARKSGDVCVLCPTGDHPSSGTGNGRFCRLKYIDSNPHGSSLSRSASP